MSISSNQSTFSNRLQIIVSNDVEFNLNQQQQSLQSSRQFFKSFSNNQFRSDYSDYNNQSRFQSIYQVNVFEKTNENFNSWLNDINDFHWSNWKKNESQSKYFYANNDYDTKTFKNVNFFISFIIDSHVCERCFITFFFKNQLFKHFRNSCWINFEINYVKSIKSSSISTKKVENRRVIESIVVSNEANSNYAFREYQYEKISIRLKSNKNIVDVCVNFDNFMIINERKFLIQQLSNAIIQKLTFFVLMRKIKNKIIKFDEFVKIKMFFDDILNNKFTNIFQSVIEVINVKIYMINDFVVNLLLNNDVIYSQSIKINSKKHRLIINKCENFRVSLNVRNRITSHVKRTIRSQRVYTFMLDDLTEVSITYHDALSNDKNFLFESQCSYELKYENKVYAHVVDSNFFKMLVRNIIDKSITLTKRVKLKTIIEYNQVDCYLTMLKKLYKTVNDWMIDRLWKKQLVVDFAIVATIYVAIVLSTITSQIDLINVTFSILFFVISIVFQIDFKLKHVLSSDVIVYEKNVIDLINLVEVFQNVFQNFDIIVNISKKKWMSINFKSSAIFKINKIYSLKVKNR